MSNVTIKNSVGKYGTNNGEDVLKIQSLLNRFILGWQMDIDVLVMDGICGKKTKAAIGTFQRLFLGHQNPDQKVDTNRETLQALNGPLNQPKKGDPYDASQQSVQRVLRESHIDKVRFTLGTDTISPKDFHAVASRFETRFLRAYFDPSLGNDARYLHANQDDRNRGIMLVGFVEATGSLQKSVIVHEATHAVCDGRAAAMFSDRAEAIAHLAQALFYRSATGYNLSVASTETTDVLTHCGNIAVRMKMDETTIVREEDRVRLLELVRRLPSVKPNAGFAYDGF